MNILNFKKDNIDTKSGFTLVETMFAVVILTFTIVALMTVVSSSLFAARYARDEITVNYLLQEVIDDIRNDRDTTVFLAPDGTWAAFLAKYSSCSDVSRGCYFDVLTNTAITQCPSGGCPNLYYNSNATTTPYYVNYDGTPSHFIGMAKTNFKRKITVTTSSADEIDVTVTVAWTNGGMALTRSLSTSFLKWQQ